jgi:hypothetical protein
MEELGSREFCEGAARESLATALAYLERADLEPAPAGDLRLLANHLLTRTK